MIKIKEYRKILKDDVSTDEQIQKRLDYLEALCRNVIEIELEKYYKSVTLNTSSLEVKLRTYGKRKM